MTYTRLSIIICTTTIKERYSSYNNVFFFSTLSMASIHIECWASTKSFNRFPYVAPSLWWFLHLLKASLLCIEICVALLVHISCNYYAGCCALVWDHYLQLLEIRTFSMTMCHWQAKTKSQTLLDFSTLQPLHTLKDAFQGFATWK